MEKERFMSTQGNRSNDEILAALPASIKWAVLPQEDYEFLDRVEIIEATSELIHLRFFVKRPLNEEETILVYDAGGEVIADFTDCKMIREEIVVIGQPVK